MIQFPRSIVPHSGKWLLALLLVLLNGAATAQTSSVTFDLSLLDNRQARLHGPGSIDTTFSTKNELVISLNTSSTYELEINPDNLTSELELDLGAEGEITALRWRDADESQTGGGFTTLGSSHYFISGGRELTLNGSSVSINYDSTDLGGLYQPDLWISAHSGGHNFFYLFPGDYNFKTGSYAQYGYGASELALEVLEDGGVWGDSIAWRLYHAHGGMQPVWDSLPSSFHSLTSGDAQLNLLGKELRVEYAIDNDQVWIYPYGKQLAASDTLAFFPGNLDIGIGAGDGLTAWVAAAFDADSESLADTSWWIDGDSSQTLVALDLEGEWLYESGDTLHIVGDTVWLDLLASDNAIDFPNVGAVEGGLQQYRLFPGDYLLKVTSTATRIRWEVDLEGEMGEWVYFDYYDDSVPVAELNCRFFTRNSDTVELHGREVTFDLSWPLWADLDLFQLKSGSQEVDSGSVATRMLLPAGYMGDLTPKGETEPHYRMYIWNENAKGGLVWPFFYKDLSLGGDPYVPDTLYPNEFYLARSGNLSLYGLPGDAPEAPEELPYAVLKEKLDAGYFLADNGELRFLYEERYAVDDSLDFRILDKTHSEVSTANVARSYGPNWVALQLGGGFTTGEFYVLEVRRPKGGVSVLRFKYQ